ncbi:hypothetical protein ABZW44_30600 [Streptomyces mirabilis]|uniref:hypothetical protein n=1 Tax=Streptomyces mirabilis TaxID=68239 RepID=UPI0033A47ABC
MIVTNGRVVQQESKIRNTGLDRLVVPFGRLRRLLTRDEYRRTSGGIGFEGIE